QPTTTTQANYQSNQQNFHSHALLQVLQEPDLLGRSLCQRHTRSVSSLIHAGIQTQGPAQDDRRPSARDGHEQDFRRCPPASLDV
ncbi:hypothetical protein BG006_004799, partial [Podila minutissima]